MPGDIHLLISEPAVRTPSAVTKVLKQGVSRLLRYNPPKKASSRQLRLPFWHAHDFLPQFWQARFCHLRKVEAVFDAPSARSSKCPYALFIAAGTSAAVSNSDGAFGSLTLPRSCLASSIHYLRQDLLEFCGGVPWTAFRNFLSVSHPVVLPSFPFTN